MVCEGRGRASEREREGGAINASRSNEVKTPQQVAFPPNKKKELNTCVHVSRGRQGPPPPHEMSTRRHHTISSSLSCPFTYHSTHMTCARFGFHLVLFWIICHLSGQHSTACLVVCLSASLSVFLFIFRLFAWLLARAIESNYNICEEGSSNHGRHGMARCDTMRS